MNDRLEQVKARNDAATPGPDEWYTKSDHDAVFASRADVPWLIAEVERLTGERDTARRDALDEAADAIERLDAYVTAIATERDTALATLKRVRYVEENYITSGNIGHQDVQVVLLSSLRAALRGEGA